MKKAQDRRSIYGAVEAGGTKFVCAAGFSPEEMIRNIVIPTERPETTLPRVIAFFDEVSAEIGDISALGVASFGPVDVDPGSPRYGQIQKTPKPGWTGFSFSDAFSKYGAPVRIESDVGGAGVGEAMAGAGRGGRSLAYVTVGTGVGVGLVKDGVPQNGVGHPELGHIRVPQSADDPYKGYCVFHGNCLEGLACGPAIVARWGKNLSELPVDHPAIDLEADYLAHLALTIILAYMPERVVFGGGVMKTAGLVEKLRARTKTLLAGYAQAPPLAGDLGDYIVVPALGDNAGVIGALHLAALAAKNAAD